MNEWRLFNTNDRVYHERKGIVGKVLQLKKGKPNVLVKFDGLGDAIVTRSEIKRVPEGTKIIPQPDGSRVVYLGKEEEKAGEVLRGAAGGDSKTLAIKLPARTE